MDAAVKTTVRTGDLTWLHANFDRLLHGPAALIATLFSVVFLSALTFWLVLGWGAYRSLAASAGKLPEHGIRL